MLTVYIARMGHDEIALQVEEGTRVRDVLTRSGMSLSGSEQAYVSGVSATMTSIVEDGDIISIVTPKQAG